MQTRWSWIFCAGVLAASCVKRDYNTTEVKDLKNAKSIERNPDGTFTVTCDSGKIEKAITEDAIKSGDVCKTEVNPLAFNAVQLWRDGKGTPILDYPAGYESIEGKTDPDDIFYVKSNTETFGKTTEGVTVKDDILTYPTKDGRSLSMKFSPAAANLTHAAAAQHCKSTGQRLPTIQELLDFCAGGKPAFFDHENGWKYTQVRCLENWLQSASVFSGNKAKALGFNGIRGMGSFRSNDYSVRCVGQ